MVNKKHNNSVQDDIEITNEIPDTTEPELADVEVSSNQKIKKLHDKLHDVDNHARELREELQRTKADFLNAKRRLEVERANDHRRLVAKHIEKLLPICDSFYLATLDEKTWSKADETWRRGIEGIYAQLTALMDSYHVNAYDPIGEIFDHHRHEALSMVPVTEPEQNNHILSVIQRGYEITHGDDIEIIRPARVTVGELQN